MSASNNEIDHSFLFLGSSVGKDYFHFKMNVEPQVNNTRSYTLNHCDCEFMCDLIQKQHLYICELENKMKGLFNEVKKLQEDLNKKDELLKSLNENVINTFIQSNYEQEQMITLLQQELDTAKSTSKIKSGYNITTSNVAQSTLTTTREDNKSYMSKRNSKEDKSFRMLLCKDTNVVSTIHTSSNNNKVVSKTQSPLQSQNQSVIDAPKHNKGINVYLHKEKLKLNDSSRSGKRNCVSGCNNNKRMQTSINASRNNSNKKQSCSNLTTSTCNNHKSNTNNNNTSEIKARINKMKLNINNKLFRPFPTVSKAKTKKKRQISSLY